MTRQRYRVMVAIAGSTVIEENLSWSEACRAVRAYGARVQSPMRALIEPMSAARSCDEPFTSINQGDLRPMTKPPTEVATFAKAWQRVSSNEALQKSGFPAERYRAAFYAGAASLFSCLRVGHSVTVLTREIDAYRDTTLNGRRTGGRLPLEEAGTFERAWQKFVEITPFGEVTDGTALEVLQGAFYLGAYWLIFLGTIRDPKSLMVEVMAAYDELNRVPGNFW